MKNSKDTESQRLSFNGRVAAEKKDWGAVNKIARKLQRINAANPEGHFLKGLKESALNHKSEAIRDFSRAITLDPSRYDAAIELAKLYSDEQQFSKSVALLEQYTQSLNNSPLYLNMAAVLYDRLGLYKKAYPLHLRTCELQPEIQQFNANLASCCVSLGKIDQAKDIYRQLLEENPQHQRNHYELSRLAKAQDDTHVRQMLEILSLRTLSHDKNIFLYYAIGKELEDLEDWETSFRYYKLAGDAASAASKYNVQSDIDIITSIENICTKEWIRDNAAQENRSKTPIFVVGLPRSGTTLTERIIASHSQVDSLDETFFMQLAIHKASGKPKSHPLDKEVILTASKKNSRTYADTYFDLAAHKMGAAPIILDKLPENYLFLGFIAKAFPNAKLVLVNRNPMDVCFAMYKQSFFRFAYNLQDLGMYYLAFYNLREHWRNVLGDRLIEIDYEKLVSDQENQTRNLLKELELPFERSCLEFDKNTAPSSTASNVQIRQKIHTQSVQRWKHYAVELRPLLEIFEAQGISVSD